LANVGAEEEKAIIFRGFSFMCGRFIVIARSEATKQSIFLGCAMDCFAEFIIGRRLRRPVGSQ
jgi:hypothetical protein